MAIAGTTLAAGCGAAGKSQSSDASALHVSSPSAEISGAPTLGVDAPDEFEFRMGSGYGKVVTGRDSSGAFPRYTSTDLKLWTRSGSLLPLDNFPPWAGGEINWAAEVHKIHLVHENRDENWAVEGFDDVSQPRGDSRLPPISIGLQRSTSPTSPFVDIGHPLIPAGGANAMDPTLLQTADGRVFIYWKHDSTPSEPHASIWGSEVSTDGVPRLIGPKQKLISADQPWEDVTVEGPEVVEQTPADPGYVPNSNQTGNQFLMMFAGNEEDTHPGSYAEGAARAPSPLGPYTQYDKPYVKTGGDWTGLGHCSTPISGPDERLFQGCPGRYSPGSPGNAGEAVPRTNIELEIFGWDQGFPLVRSAFPKIPPP